jgi:hypothetical protein
MIWFLSWVMSTVLMAGGAAVYLWVLNGDPALLTREVNDLAPPSSHWQPGAYATPALQAALYVICLALAWWNRGYLRTRKKGEQWAIAYVLGPAQLLFANPAGRRLTQWYVPLVNGAVALSAPLVQIEHGLSPFVWGTCMLFGVTLIGTALRPDPPEIERLYTPPVRPALPPPERPTPRRRWYSLQRTR